MKTEQLYLSAGERLELNRRRDGLSQAEAADLFGVSVARFRKWEHGTGRAQPLVNVGPALTDGEWCWLMRRRAGRSLKEVSEETGLGIQWIHRVERGERGDPAALVRWWQHTIGAI